MEFKINFGLPEGKSHQIVLPEDKATILHNRRIGETINGNELGFEGYEFLLTGGSDKCGFPMRKGIQEARKVIMVSKGVGCKGKQRKLRKKTSPRKQQGLLRRKTVCGEFVTKIIRQINLKVTKVGAKPLIDVPVEESQ